MLKNKLDYKLVNFALIALIVFLLYQTGNLWTGVLGKILEIKAYHKFPNLIFKIDSKELNYE